MTGSPTRGNGRAADDLHGPVVGRVRRLEVGQGRRGLLCLSSSNRRRGQAGREGGGRSGVGELAVGSTPRCRMGS